MLKLEDMPPHEMVAEIERLRFSLDKAAQEIRRMSISTCAVTGRIAGDSDACGDCDPCLFGASRVPDAVKHLIREKDDWRDLYADAMSQLDQSQETGLAKLRVEFRSPETGRSIDPDNWHARMFLKDQ